MTYPAPNGSLPQSSYSEAWDPSTALMRSSVSKLVPCESSEHSFDIEASTFSLVDHYSLSLYAKIGFSEVTTHGELTVEPPTGSQSFASQHFPH